MPECLKLCQRIGEYARVPIVLETKIVCQNAKGCAREKENMLKCLKLCYIKVEYARMPKVVLDKK